MPVYRKNTDRMVTIYALSDPRSGAPKYIGQTYKPLEMRLKQHSTSCCSRPLHRWLTQLQTEHVIPLIYPLEEVPHHKADEREKYHILANAATVLNHRYIQTRT